MKVGSDRQAASSHSGPTSLPTRSAIQQYGICAGGPSKSGPVIWEFTPTKLFRSYFTICFLPEPGPEERGGGGWDGSRTRPETADLFWKKNMKYVILYSKSMTDCVLEK